MGDVRPGGGPARAGESGRPRLHPHHRAIHRPRAVDRKAAGGGGDPAATATWIVRHLCRVLAPVGATPASASPASRCHGGKEFPLDVPGSSSSLTASIRNPGAHSSIASRAELAAGAGEGCKGCKSYERQVRGSGGGPNG